MHAQELFPRHFARVLVLAEPKKDTADAVSRHASIDSLAARELIRHGGLDRLCRGVPARSIRLKPRGSRELDSAFFRNGARIFVFA